MLLDCMDKCIFKVLQKDGCIGNVELVKKLGMSVIVCWNYIKWLMDEGYVKEVWVIFDFEKLGLLVLVIVGVVLDWFIFESFVEFEKVVCEIVVVQECLLLVGEFDYWIKLCVKDL